MLGRRKRGCGEDREAGMRLRVSHSNLAGVVAVTIRQMVRMEWPRRRRRRWTWDGHCAGILDECIGRLLPRQPNMAGKQIRTTRGRAPSHSG